MKLYTINATPYVNRVQARALGVQPKDLNEFNTTNIQHYPNVVAGVLETQGISGCTIEQTTGFWRGKAEVSFKISVATDDVNRLHRVCEVLKKTYNQESVMLTMPNNDVEFV